ncbi:tRNA pseudouridine(55) synthase TruB [Guggenheimella bovis]
MYGRVDIHKPMGLTSHDVVNRVRRVFNERHVGHSGTLDPNASGVLNVYVGRSATKFIDILKSDSKEYIATMKLGLESDTYDIWGDVKQTSRKDVSEQTVNVILQSFLGKSEQVPPMYSALKRNGRPLYEYARQGIELERKEREIWISEMELLKFDGENIQFRTRCSKGTYIRSLVVDIAAKLDQTAVMSELIRTENDSISLKDTISLDALSVNSLKPVDDGVPLERWSIQEDTLKELYQGKQIHIDTTLTSNRIILMCNGTFVGTAIRKGSTYVRERMYP